MTPKSDAFDAEVLAFITANPNCPGNAETCELIWKFKVSKARVVASLKRLEAIGSIKLFAHTVYRAASPGRRGGGFGTITSKNYSAFIEP
jgi:hypothetical protein